MGGAALDDARRLGEDESESALLAGERTPAPAKLTELGGRRKHKGDFGPADVSHPDSYVVQEGDTLYKIALRFYGRTSAWKMIREANKESITTDGRVRTGQTLKLPK
jgi:nucleoid-associated protein YgaU